MSKRNRTIIISVVVLILIGAGFLFLRSGGEDPILQVQTVEGTDGAGTTVISLLARLRTVEFNEDIFSSPGFLNLVDNGIELKPQARGRSNPFAPVGTDAPLDIEPDTSEPDIEEQTPPEEETSTTTPPAEEESN